MIVPTKDILNENLQKKSNKVSRTIQIIIITLENLVKNVNIFDTMNAVKKLSMICHNTHKTSQHLVN